MKKDLFIVLFSALCYYFGNGLHGDFWYLVWLAPIPVIYRAMTLSGRNTFLVAFIVYAIGRLSWFGYLLKVITLVPTLIFTIVPALIFALVILLTRNTVLRYSAWYTVFVFPVLSTAFEFVFLRLAPHGSAGSIAYSQMNCLPCIQIASVAGILGITFIITLFPAVIALSAYFKNKRVVYIGGGLVAAAILFGFIRLQHGDVTGQMKAGIVVGNEAINNNGDSIGFYLRKIDSVAREGVQVVLLPERAIMIDKSSERTRMEALQHAAVKNNTFLVSGYTNHRGDKAYNSAIVIDNKGNIVADYNKVHLIPVLEDEFAHGDQKGVFNIGHLDAGVAVCKDLDFPDYIRSYRGCQLVFIPAWDFGVDDWLHGRMALLRGVEDGFSEVRAARVGLLTISDPYGRVVGEGSSADDRSAVLMGNVPLLTVKTLYSTWGDWLGYLSVVLTFLILAGLVFPVISPGNRQ